MNALTTTARAADARLATGVRLRYVEQGEGPGLPVVMLHGYTDSSYSFSRVLPLLDPAGRRVYALDLRGHGDSERPADGYTVEQFAADVIAFMDGLGVGRAALVGHCMGSLVAQRVALKAPARVAGLLLVSSMTTARRIAGVEELRRAVEGLDGEVPEEFAREFQEGTVHHRLPAEFMDGVVRESLKLPARVWRATLAGLLADEHVSRLADIGAKTVAVWGDRDALLDRAEQDALVSAVGAELVVYAETGHSPHWERPVRFARDLAAFAARAETG